MTDSHTTKKVVEYLNSQFIQDTFGDADRMTVMNFLIGFSEAIKADLEAEGRLIP